MWDGCGGQHVNTLRKQLWTRENASRKRDLRYAPAWRYTACPRPPFRDLSGPHRPLPRPHGPSPRPFPAAHTQTAHSSPHVASYILRCAAAANLLRRRCRLRAGLGVHVAASRGSGPSFERLRSQHAIGRDSARSSCTTSAMTIEAASAACDGCVARCGRACSVTRAHMVLAVVKGHARHAPFIAKPRHHHAHAHLRAWLAVVGERQASLTLFHRCASP